MLLRNTTFQLVNRAGNKRLDCVGNIPNDYWVYNVETELHITEELLVNKCPLNVAVTTHISLFYLIFYIH